MMNSCFFQGPNQIEEESRERLDLAGPRDDDRDNDLDGSVCADDSSVTCEVVIRIRRTAASS